MTFMGVAHGEDFDYIEKKIENGRKKIKEFPILSSILDDFKNVSRSNYNENLFLNLANAAFSDPFLSGNPNLRYKKMLRDFDLLLTKILPKLNRAERNKMISRLRAFGKNHVEVVNELEFYSELENNSNVADIEYENPRKGKHDFSLKIGQSEFSIELTTLGKSKLQEMLEEGFTLAAQEIIGYIPDKVFLKLSIITDRVLKEESNSSEEIRKKIISDFKKIKEIALVDLNGLCIFETNLGNPEEDLLTLKDFYGYYKEFGERLSALEKTTDGLIFLRKCRIKDIMENSFDSFIIGERTKSKRVEIHSRSIWPSKSEALRKKSLLKQLERRIKDKIDLEQLKGKVNPIIALNFSDFIFHDYSEDNPFAEEDFNELRRIVEDVFNKKNEEEILGVLIYDRSLKKSKLIQNTKRKIDKEIIDKINLLKN